MEIRSAEKTSKAVMMMMMSMGPSSNAATSASAIVS